jgi:hypothetical protein
MASVVIGIELMLGQIDGTARAQQLVRISRLGSVNRTRVGRRLTALGIGITIG